MIKKVFIILVTSLLFTLAIHSETIGERVVRLETQIEQMEKNVTANNNYIDQDMSHKADYFKTQQKLLESQKESRANMNSDDWKDIITWIFQGLMAAGVIGHGLKPQVLNNIGNKLKRKE